MGVYQQEGDVSGLPRGGNIEKMGVQQEIVLVFRFLLINGILHTKEKDEEGTRVRECSRDSGMFIKRSINGDHRKTSRKRKRSYGSDKSSSSMSSSRE